MREHAVDQKDLVVGGGQRALHEARAVPPASWRSISSRITDAAPAPLQRGLVQPHQVFRLFLDFHFGIADDAEGALTLDA